MRKPTRDYLTKEQQRFLIKLEEIGRLLTDVDVRVLCLFEGVSLYPKSVNEYLDLCANREHFWVCFGEKAEFYIVPQTGPVMENIADYYSTAAANTIYEILNEEFGE